MKEFNCSIYLIVKIKDLKNVMKKLQQIIYDSLDKTDVRLNQMPLNNELYVFETIQNHVANIHEEGFINEIKNFLKVRGIESKLMDKPEFDLFIKKLEEGK